MNLEPPQVSIVMGVYNEAQLLPRALDSLLNQGDIPLEIIVVDDGSTDETPNILAAFQNRDERIRTLTLPVNGGLTHALNEGLALARAPLIARLDADDQALPQKITRQVAFLNQHPEVALVGGTWKIDDGKQVRLVSPPQEDALLRWYILFANPFCHSAVMFRRHVGGESVRYNPVFPFAQDYDLWSRLMTQGKVANLAGEPLIRCHIRVGSISHNQKGEQALTALRIANLHQRQLLPGISLEETNRLRTAFLYPKPLDGSQAGDFRTLLVLYRQFCQRHTQQESMLVSSHLVKSMLDAVGASALGLAWRSGLLWDLMRSMPVAFLNYGIARLINSKRGKP